MIITEKYYGYVIQSGYRGWVKRENRWMLFSTEDEYIEYVNEEDEED